jgi:G protein-coupled receptor 158
MSKAVQLSPRFAFVDLPLVEIKSHPHCYCRRGTFPRLPSSQKAVSPNLRDFFLGLHVIGKHFSFQVAIHFLPATTWRCMLEPWLREIGFIICYGAIVLKLYRHLVEFRTRKAHRYVVRDLDLLRYLCAMIVAVLCYLAAFTALCIDYLDYSELVWNVEMESITTSNMCKPLKWDYVSVFLSLSLCVSSRCETQTNLESQQQVTQAGEMLILTFGIQLAYASRNAITQFRVCLSLPSFFPLHFPSTKAKAIWGRAEPSDTLVMSLSFSINSCQERQFLVVSIVIEFIVSFSFYIFRDCYLSELNPTTLFLAMFIRSQLTSTITMVLIFVPKIYYQHKQVSFAFCFPFPTHRSFVRFSISLAVPA